MGGHVGLEPPSSNLVDQLRRNLVVSGKVLVKNRTGEKHRFHSGIHAWPQLPSVFRRVEEEYRWLDELFYEQALSVGKGFILSGKTGKGTKHFSNLPGL